jgi:hypothetical protein
VSPPGQKIFAAVTGPFVIVIRVEMPASVN